MSLPLELKKALRYQRYHFIGKSGLVKPCRWLWKSLTSQGQDHCYKQRFYGIRSHKCVQFTPVPACSQACLFCWRVQPTDLGLKWDELSWSEYDDPKELIDSCIREHKRILTGYGSNRKVSREMLEDAMAPNHLTASLVGEPTLYGAERLSTAFEEAFKRGFKTIFLVSNGTFPEVLSNLSVEPSQLYLSVCAPDEETYRRVCRPRLGDGWKRLLESIELLRSFKCPTVIRMTLARGLNLKDPEGYAKLVMKGNSTYVEPKGAMNVGYGLQTGRMKYEHMPKHWEIMDFSKRLSEITGYRILDDVLKSEVALLSRLEKPVRFDQ
ncbi:MAG: 4-demethylwyosine synthase TYW1 [Promethearchaeati archaeon SRVP18_Atabeyarchaeia-1]